MTEQEIREDDSDAVICWSCDKDVLIKELRANDGFCPLCDQEIEL